MWALVRRIEPTHSPQKMPNCKGRTVNGEWSGQQAACLFTDFILLKFVNDGCADG